MYIFKAKRTLSRQDICFEFDGNLLENKKRFSKTFMGKIRIFQKCLR